MRACRRYASVRVMEKSQTDTTQEAGTIYEVSYLFLPTLGENEAAAELVSLKSAISASGAIIADEGPILIDLAYPIVKVVQTIRHKISSAYFGWVKFEMASGEVAKIKNYLDNQASVARYLVIKTVRENTLLAGKMTLKREEKMKQDQENIEEAVADATPTPAEESSSEEIDKSIDDLVIA